MHPNHKRNFSFNNFHTEFSSKGCDNIEMDARACFNSLVSYHRVNEPKFGMVLRANDICSNTYNIIIYLDDYGDENNCCFMSKEELSEWMEDMKRFAEFEYEINENETYKNSWILKLEFTKRPFAEHFLVLEFVKHTYEFPFSYSSYQAVKMRNIINKDELLVNLHNMIFCCNIDFKNIACSDHILFTYEYVYKAFRRANNTIRVDMSYHYPIVYLPSAEEIKERCKKTNRLVNIFNPFLVDINNINNYDCFNKSYNIYYLGEGFEKLNSLPYREKIYKFSQDFKYFDNHDNNVKSQNFDEYFDVNKCKERLDCYIETYDKIKDYGKCQSE